MSPLLAKILQLAAPGVAGQYTVADTPGGGADFQNMVSQYNNANPAAPTADMTPEPPAVAAPQADAGPSVPVPTTQAPAQSKKHGILGALESVFMPDPDSRWAAALRGGIWDAKANQIAYKNAQIGTVLAQQKTAADTAATVAKAKRGEVYTSPTGAIVRDGADGVQTLYTPPEKVGEQEKLIDKWHQAIQSGDTTLANVIEHAIRGYQYTQPVIDAQTASRNSTAEARAAATAKYRAPKAAPKPPSGFILDN